MPTQNTRRIRPFSFLAGFMISVLALSASAYAQSPAKPGPDGITVVNPQPQAQTANSAQLPKATAHNEGSHGSQEGIKVHGHWIIDVKNPDGSLADHRDFENSLSNANVLVAFLYGSEVPSDFVVLLGGGTNAPCTGGSTGYPCAIVRNLSSLPANAICGTYYCVTGLTVTPTFGSSPSLVLAGNLTATQAGSINSVSTEIGLCGSPTTTLTTTSSATCATGANGYGYSGLTSTAITSIPIVSGQIIQVTVTITFS